MTDAMLRLARAVYPQYEWTMYGSYPYRECETEFERMVCTAVLFDPANNADQFCDVLAWMASRNHIELYDDSVLTNAPVDGEINLITISHDGTGAGIRAAAVEAATRVVK